MTYLTFSINGSPIPVPSILENIQNKADNFGQGIIQTGINVLLVVAVLLAMLALIWGGIDWTRSEGDKERIEKARHKILYALLGLGIAFLSFVIINVIGYFFQVNLIGQ